MIPCTKKVRSLLSFILKRVLQDLKEINYIILHTRIDMESPPQNESEQHTQYTSGKYVRSPSFLKSANSLQRTNENTFANMSVIQR